MTSNQHQDLEILYEDQWFIVVNKPPGLSVQDDKTKGRSLHHLVSIHYRAQGDDVRIWLVHRIDKRASGAVLFAKSKSATAKVSEMFKAGSVAKLYWAVTATKPETETGQWDDFISKNGRINKSFISETEKEGAKACSLKYSLIAKSDRYFLLEISLLTGKHHQIRAQMSHRNMPIKGDIKYGSKRTNKDGSIHLHSRGLSFQHPFNSQPIRILAPVPNEVVWQVLSQQN